MSKIYVGTVFLRHVVYILSSDNLFHTTKFGNKTQTKNRQINAKVQHMQPVTINMMAHQLSSITQKIITKM